MVRVIIFLIKWSFRKIRWTFEVPLVFTNDSHRASGTNEFHYIKRE